MKNWKRRLAYVQIVWAAIGLCVMPAAPLRAQQDDAGAADASGDQGDQPADKPDDKPPAKKDPTDIRSAIGNLDLVRGMDRLSAPQKPGTWSTLIDQPYFSPEMKAQKNLFHGQYEKAETLFQSLLKTEPQNQDDLEGYLESILEQGHDGDIKRFVSKYETLTSQQKATAKMSWMRAEAYLASGQSGKARDVLKAFVDAHPKIDVNDGELIQAYVDYGGLLERDAEYTAASGIYEQVTSAIQGKLPSDSKAATQVAIATYRAARLSGDTRDRQADVMNQLAHVRNEDQTYWPAILQEAEVLIAAHNDRQAGQAIGQVLDLNPNELEARFVSMAHAMGEFDFDNAQDQLTQLKKRTDQPMVAAMEGRMWLREREPEKALNPLLAAVKKDATLPEARGWLAGAYYLLNQPDKMDEQLAAIKIGANGRHPTALFEAAEILSDARQFTAAEKLYLEAMQGAPWWSEPPAALAQLYLEMGEEDKARAMLDKSYKMDPYNMRAVNQISLLETLHKFSTKESKSRTPGTDKPAFIVRYTPQDEVLAGLVIEWMESVRPVLWDYFKINTLPAPTTIEIFPSHEEFGVRTTGLPWIGTVGASTGSVIAIDAPRAGDKTPLGTFDWARVLRHEYTHTITLAMTNNRIPHWLTEAAAVVQEQSPRDWENCQLLCSNYRAGTLFKIADLNWGFIKPKRTIDRQLAYMQSQWLYEYLVATYGQDKMLDFLQCFHDGLTEPAAWKKTYRKTSEEMDKDFGAWAAIQIDKWGLPNTPLPKREDVDAALTKDPNDAGALYNRAWLKVSAGDGGLRPRQDLAGAREDLEKVLTIKPTDVPARELLGAVLNAQKERDKAKEMLEGVVKDDAKRPVTLRTLGLIGLATKDYAYAAKWFEKLQEVRPMEQTSYTSLAGIYLATGQNDKAAAQLLELEKHEQFDERIPRKLADLYRSEGKLEDAEAAAYRSIRINPFDAINHELMAQILVQEKQVGKSIEYWHDATVLQPTIAEFWEGLADAKGETGDAAGASDAAKKALELSPNSAAKKWIK